jgi:hypothetical protein
MAKDSSECKDIPEDCPLFYLYVYKLMVDKFGKMTRIVTSKDIIECWRRSIHNIPRRYDYVVLKEMERYRFIESINRTQAYFNGSLFTRENISKRLNKMDEIARLLDMKAWRFFGKRSNERLEKLREEFPW